MRSVRVVAALVLVTTLATACVGDARTRWNANLPGKVASAAVTLGEDPATRYHGSLDGEDGQIEFDLSITRHGEGYGKLFGPFTAEVMTVDDELYIKADESYWKEVEAEKAGQYANQWVHAEEVGEGFDMSLFTPQGIRNAVESAAAAIDPVIARSGEQVEINGEQALKIRAPETTFYVTAATPHRLLRIEGAAADVDKLSLDLEPLDDNAAKKLYDQLTTLTKQPVHDPAATDQVSLVDRKFGTCAVTCQVIATLQNASSRAVQAQMVVTIHADGQVRGNCTITFTIQPRGTSTGSCVVTSAAWQSWYRWAQRTPGRHEWEARFLVTSVRTTIDATPRQPD